MHDLMLGMFVGGVVLALPPVLIGLAFGAYLLQQRRREQNQESLHDRPGE
jgi:hypothetical protein